MKKLYFLIAFILIYGCANSKSVYWCGDHPCINKEEKESYFKKTMSVEVKSFSKKMKEKDPEIKKIVQQARINEKERLESEKDIKKKLKLEKRKKSAEKKRLLKQAKYEEKIRKKNEGKRKKIEKKLAKIIEKDEKKKPKIKKENLKKHTTSIDSVNRITDEFGSFQKLVEKIIQKNILRPYPDINDIPN